MTAYNAAHRQHTIPAARLETLQAGLSSHCTTAALAAVPGDATATATGMWLTTRSGRLSAQLTYVHAANDYIRPAAPTHSTGCRRRPPDRVNPAHARMFSTPI
ncbi:hypothetical protein [Verrucosispora sp. WMMC514]|uniref:hypothetical protein n=1 Tax=Verrucosispora sp. WMMC514 TaxID=3015156 RepID=UPI00248A9D6A|nr:hypothetical protein [Verrucosispora sp. WMMC514]WBB91435.1 hypothetical protein O7597_31515 [Verrucosispora sp. WMMC514]